MAGLGYDLIVDDDGIKKEAEELLKKINGCEMQLGTLAEILQRITENAIMEGNTADNLKVFVEQVKNLHGEAREITEQLKRLAYRYIDAMDAADSCVY